MMAGIGIMLLAGMFSLICGAVIAALWYFGVFTVNKVGNVVTVAFKGKENVDASK